MALNKKEKTNDRMGKVAVKKLFKAYNKTHDEEVELRNQIMPR